MASAPQPIGTANFNAGYAGSSGGAGASGSWDASDDGLTIVPSPVQLATILKQGTLVTGTRFVTRLYGGGQIFFAALQLVGSFGLLAAPDPTLVTKAGGVALFLHGIDSGVAGVRQLWTGQTTKDLTQIAGERAAKSLGASDRTAAWAGIALDVAVPLSVSGALAATRVLGVWKGGLSLAAEEQAGGHTILKHVGRTEAQLRTRLVEEPKIPAAGSFDTLRSAETAVSKAIAANEGKIQTWAASKAKKLVFEHTLPSVIGKGVVRSTGVYQEMRAVRVVLQKTTIVGKVYFVLTSFPIP